MLFPNTPAPDFDLSDQHGNRVRLSAYRGRWLVLWWYAQADTPG